MEDLLMGFVVAWIAEMVIAYGPVAFAPAAAAAIVYAEVIGTILLVSASVAYSSAQQRKLKKSLAGLGQGGVDQGRTLMVRDPVAPRRLIYGEVLVSGPLAFIHTSGTNNDYLHLIIVLAAHECDTLGDIYFNDEIVPLDGSGNATGAYAGYARVKKFTGIAAGERDTDLETESGGIWTSAHLGKSVARLHVRLKYSNDIFPTGMPVIKCLVKGKKVYDPRTTTTVWSANSALCTGDFLMDSVIGKGVALARIGDAAWQEAANICDESVILTDASTESRYTCNGTVVADVSPNDSLQDIVGSMAGHLSDSGGQWTVRAGAYRTPTLTLTDSEVVGSLQIVARQSRQDCYNGVRGTFIGPINQYAEADFPVVKNDTYKANDGGIRLWKDIALNFTDSAATAQRLAKIDLEVGRQQITVIGDFNLKAMQCQVGDVIMLTRSRMGWSAKTFEVVNWALKLEGGSGEEGQGPTVKVNLTLRETASGVWDWANGEETAVDLAPNTTLYNPRTVETPTGLTLNSASWTVTAEDGTIVPRLRATWTAPTNQHIIAGGKVEIEYRISGGTWLKWVEVEGSATEDFLTDIKAGINYDVRIKFRNVNGVRGAYQTVTAHTVAGDTTAPSIPASMVATAGPSSVLVDWADNSDSDLSKYETYRHTSNDSAAAALVWVGKASAFVDGKGGSRNDLLLLDKGS
jgi:hypothetical protein